jgi:hypothetical protein
MVAEVAPLVGVIAVAGPPALPFVGALVFGALMLAGAFALAVTLVVAMALAAVLVAALVALLVVVPYLLITRVSRAIPAVAHRARARAAMPAPRVQILPVLGRHERIA